MNATIDPAEHVGLAWTVASEWAKRFDYPVAAGDLIGYAYELLCRAAKNYDPTRGVTFAHYALEGLRLQWPQARQVHEHGRRLRKSDLKHKPVRYIPEIHESHDEPVGELDMGALSMLDELTPMELTVVEGGLMGLTMAEIARNEGLSLNQVRVIRRNARDRLRELFGVEHARGNDFANPGRHGIRYVHRRRAPLTEAIA